VGFQQYRATQSLRSSGAGGGLGLTLSQHGGADEASQEPCGDGMGRMMAAPSGVRSGSWPPARPLLASSTRVLTALMSKRSQKALQKAPAPALPWASQVRGTYGYLGQTDPPAALPALPALPPLPPLPALPALPWSDQQQEVTVHSPPGHSGQQRRNVADRIVESRPSAASEEWIHSSSSQYPGRMPPPCRQQWHSVPLRRSSSVRFNSWSDTEHEAECGAAHRSRGRSRHPRPRSRSRSFLSTPSSSRSRSRSRQRRLDAADRMTPPRPVPAMRVQPPPAHGVGHPRPASDAFAAHSHVGTPMPYATPTGGAARANHDSGQYRDWFASPECRRSADAHWQATDVHSLAALKPPPNSTPPRPERGRRSILQSRSGNITNFHLAGPPQDAFDTMRTKPPLCYVQEGRGPKTRRPLLHCDSLAYGRESFK